MDEVYAEHEIRAWEAEQVEIREILRPRLRSCPGRTSHTSVIEKSHYKDKICGSAGTILHCRALSFLSSK